MQETPLWLKSPFVTLARSKGIAVPSRKLLLQISTLLHPVNNLKSTMTHCSWTSLCLDRRIHGISQSKYRGKYMFQTWYRSWNDCCWRKDTEFLIFQEIASTTKEFMQAWSGTFTEIPVTLAYKNRSCRRPVIIVKNRQQNFLGLPAIKLLSLLTLIEMANTPIQCPPLFNGLGTFPECYIWNQDPQPFAPFISTVKCLPLTKKESRKIVSKDGIS